MSSGCSGGPTGGGRRTVAEPGRRRPANRGKARLMFAAQDQGTRRAGARGLTRNRHGAMARRLRGAAASAVCAAAIAVPLISAAGAQAATTNPPIYTPLTLINGWTNYGSGTANAAVTSINGIVHFKGAIHTSSGNTNDVAF